LRNCAQTLILLRSAAFDVVGAREVCHSKRSPKVTAEFAPERPVNLANPTTAEGRVRRLQLSLQATRADIREISRRTGLSRNTIRKYLRADIVEPNFRTPTRPSKLDPFAEKLSGWLLTEQRKSRKERRTAKQMHADLVQLGFDGSYERVAAFVRAWKADRQHAQQQH